MTVVLPTPDFQEFHAFTQGDERALKSIFRQEYDGLLAQAQETLGSDLAHASPRVVQQAMLATWRRRADFEQPIGLVAFLETAVQDESALARRKHAALNHRQGAPVAHRAAVIPTADEAVAQLDALMHVPAVDHDVLIEEARAAKKHHAAEHVQAVGRERAWRLPAALVVVAIVAIVAAQRWAQARGSDMVATRALESTEARNIVSQRGQRGAVTLGDDSRAKLGSESKLRLPKEFGTTLRTLQLTGTARFEVASGKPMPFTVRAGNMDITAVGTAFAVRAFPEDSGMSVLVDEGSVKVRVRDTRDDHTVSSGEAVRIGRDGNLSPLVGGARDALFAWTRDSLVFENVRLADVVPQLVRWFDLNVSVADAAVGEKRVSVRLGLQSSGAALEAVAKAAGVTTGFGKDKGVVLK